MRTFFGSTGDARTVLNLSAVFTQQRRTSATVQGGEISISETKTQIFERVIYENAVRNRIDHDFVIIHDPQPLPLIVEVRFGAVTARGENLDIAILRLANALLEDHRYSGRLTRALGRASGLSLDQYSRGKDGAPASALSVDSNSYV